jgi:hypothetical protein
MGTVFVAMAAAAIVVALATILGASPLAAASEEGEETQTASIGEPAESQAADEAATAQDSIVQAIAPVPITNCDDYNGTTYDGFYCTPDGSWSKSSSGGGSGCTWQAHVDWGDGTSTDYTWSSGEILASHTYTKPGFAYHIVITGSGSPTSGSTSSCNWIPTHYIVAVPKVSDDCGTPDWGKTDDIEGTAPKLVKLKTKPKRSWSDFKVNVSWGDFALDTVVGGGSYEHTYKRLTQSQPNTFPLKRTATWQQEDGKGGKIQCKSEAPPLTVKVYDLVPGFTITPKGMDYKTNVVTVQVDSVAVPAHLIKLYEWQVKWGAVEFLYPKAGKTTEFKVPCPVVLPAHVPVSVDHTVTSVDGNSKTGNKGINVFCPDYDPKYRQAASLALQDALLTAKLLSIDSRQEVTQAQLRRIAKDLTAVWDNHYIINNRKTLAEFQNRKQDILFAAENSLIEGEAAAGISTAEAGAILTRTAAALELVPAI